REGELVAGGGLVAVRVLRGPRDDAGDVGAVARDGGGDVAVHVGGGDDLDRAVGGVGAASGASGERECGDGGGEGGEAAGACGHGGACLVRERSARNGRSPDYSLLITIVKTTIPPV